MARPIVLLGIVIIEATSLAPAEADSDGPSVEVRGGLGVSSMLSTAQREQGFQTGFVPELHPALRVSDMFAAELALASWFFPRDGGIGRATMLGGGLRWDTKFTTWLSWFVDGHAGVALTGDNNRFMFDAGTGFEVWLKRNLAVGPFVRYGQVNDREADPKFWAAGLRAAITLSSGSDEPPSLGYGGTDDKDREQRQRDWERTRVRERQSPRLRDRDRDGVVDERDICPDEPRGATPDPSMNGCPLKDRDNDGVPDEQDRCPSEPAGTRRDAHRTGCPAVDDDDDGDGVPNREDQCRDRAFGAHPDPLAMGCPLPDRDKDGVPDLHDACPAKPGAPDTSAKANGCPGLVTIARGAIRIARPILFSTNRDAILSSSFPVLRAIVNALKATPAINKLSVEGHTDASLPPEQSMELSRRRAESVRRWLVENGVEGHRLQSRGHGDTQPLASNRTANGRAANQRVELIIVDGSLDSGSR